MKKLNRKEEEGDEGNIGSCYIVFTGRNMHSRGRKMQMVPCFGGVEIVLCLWITSAVLTLVASQQKFYIQGRYGKRQEPRTGERKSYMYIHIHIYLPETIEIHPYRVSLVLPFVFSFSQMDSCGAS